MTLENYDILKWEGRRVSFDSPVDGVVNGTLTLDRQERLGDDENTLQARVYIKDSKDTKHRLPGCSKSVTVIRFLEYYDINRQGKITSR